MATAITLSNKSIVIPEIALAAAEEVITATMDRQVAATLVMLPTVDCYFKNEAGGAKFLMTANVPFNVTLHRQVTTFVVEGSAVGVLYLMQGA